jgi:hypothetical protein
MKKYIYIFASLIIFTANTYSQGRVVSPQEYFEIVRANELRNRNTEFTVTGAVFGIRQAGSDNYQVCFSILNQIFLLTCVFRSNNTLMNLNPGDIVTIQGTCERDDLLLNCALLSEENKPQQDMSNIIFEARTFNEYIKNRQLNQFGKYFTVRGVVRGINQNSNGYYVRLNDVEYSYFYFASSQIDNLMNLNAGDFITIRGMLRDRDVMGFLHMRECVIIN